MHRLVFLTLALGLVAVLTAAAARSERTNPAKVRNGKISFWSDRAFGGRAQVFVMNPNGTQQRRLTKLFSAKRADFSSDGRMLVLDGRGRETLHDFDVFVMNADGTGLRMILGGETEVAAWSRDGARILFTSYRDGNPNVYVVRAEGSGLRRLTRDGGEDYAADFSPDAREILFSSTRTGLRQVYVMNLDGSGVKNVTRSRSNDWATSWQPLRR